MEPQFQENVSLLTAFFAGVLSFLSPCVLPLIPGYISFISGESVQALRNSEEIRTTRKRVILSSLFFVIGFSFIFILLGASATTLGRFLLKYLKIFSIIAGIIVIILGLHMTGILRIKALYYEKKFQVQKKPVNVFGSFLIGIAFAFGWTPCIGPILAAILAVAAAQNTIIKGMLLLTVYSLGLAIPFMITAYSITLFFKLFDKIKKYFNIIEWVSGILLIIIGIMMITGLFARITHIFGF